jgi:hypothetical protein
MSGLLPRRKLGNCLSPIWPDAENGSDNYPQAEAIASVFWSLLLNGLAIKCCCYIHTQCVIFRDQPFGDFCNFDTLSSKTPGVRKHFGIYVYEAYAKVVGGIKQKKVLMS